MYVHITAPSALIAATGELDIFAARDVATRLRDASRLGCSQVTVDVGQVSFVDVSALGVFARARAILNAEGTSMAFASMSPSFERLCSIARLDDAFGLQAV